MFWLKNRLLTQTLSALLAGLAGCTWVLWPESHWGVFFLGTSLLGLALVAPVWALVLLAFILPFEQPRLTAWGTIYTGEMGLLACLPGFAWNVLRQRAWQRAWPPVANWVLPFVLVLCCSVLLHLSAVTLKGFLRWSEFILLLVFAIHILRRGREAEKIFWALLLAAVISSCWGIGQTQHTAGVFPLTLRQMTSQGEVTRAAAGFGPNTLAIFLSLLLPYALAAALFHPRGWGRALGLLASPLLAAGIWLTFSFTGWLALAVGGAAVLVMLGHRSPRLGVWLLAAAGLGLAALALWHPGFFSPAFFTNKLASLQDRLGYFAAAGRLLQANPWLGCGAGEYRFLALQYSGAGGNLIGYITHPHSLWLQVLAETGWLGLAALLLALVRIVRFMLQKLAGLAAGWPLAAGLAVFAGLAGFASANGVEQALVHDRGMHAALFLAAALAWVRRPANPARPERRSVFDAAWEATATTEWKNVLAERQQGRKVLYACLEQALAGKKQPKILELGCGPALDAVNVGMTQGRQVHALDVSERALQLARSAGRHSRVKILFHQADVRQTGLAAGAFDLVFSQGLLEHFPDPQPVWREIHRLLKPGGCAVMDVPQALNPYSLIKLGRRFQGNWAWGWETQYTVGRLRSEAALAGLEMLSAHGYGYYGGRWDITRRLQKLMEPHFTSAWKKWEAATGAYWMMNVVGVFGKRKGLSTCPRADGGCQKQPPQEKIVRRDDFFQCRLRVSTQPFPRLLPMVFPQQELLKGWPWASMI